MLCSCVTGYLSSDAGDLDRFLTPEALKELVDNPDPNIWIIDVRPETAYRAGHIPTARSYPSSQIMDRLEEIPEETYLILYCETGGRAQAVIEQLESAGFNRNLNWGGYSRWPYPLEKD